MCHKLLQIYACGHNATVCKTPCPHAIATGRRIPGDHRNAPDLSRSSSVVSSTALSSTPPARRNDVQDLPSQRVRDAEAQVYSLRTAVLSNQAQQQGSGSAPAFRFMAPGTDPEAEGGRCGHPQSQPTSPASLSPTSPTFEQPSPTFSTTGTLIDAPLSTYTPSPSTFFTPADPEIDTSTVDPNFCGYYFPRYLPRLSVPCKGCYPQPEWEKNREAWRKLYREQHPGVKEEEIEVLSGISAVMKQFGW